MGFFYALNAVFTPSSIKCSIERLSNFYRFFVELIENVLQMFYNGNTRSLKSKSMAAVREVILPHHKKEDGTWNLKIRVTHKRKAYYIDTQHFVGSKQIRKDFTVKDPIILKIINPVLDNYRSRISDLGERLATYDAKSLFDYLKVGEMKAEKINVIEFGKSRIEELRAANRTGSAGNLVTVVNSLVDYFKNDVVPVSEITAKCFAFTKNICGQTGINHVGKPVTVGKNGLSEAGLHNHMPDLRILFNTIKDYYNDEDKGQVVIKHYPFKKYKIKEAPLTEKRKLSIKQLISIRDCAC
ncbi:MAG: recombinase [Daejeonella sp.]|nr:recombinase [Daejeonella sp.]